MFGFGRKKVPVDTGADVADMVLVPVDLNAAHSFAAPGESEYAAHPTYGQNPYAAQVYKDLPDIKNQDAILSHFFQPPPAKPPEEWYNDRNAAKIQQGNSQEHFQTGLVEEYQQRPNWAVNPWQTTEDSNRVTAHSSPSNYRFVRPFDQRFNRALNGTTGSLATVAHPYPVGGMQPARNLRNTIRITPPDRDTENYDLQGTTASAAVPAVHVSPSVNAQRRYGL